MHAQLPEMTPAMAHWADVENTTRKVLLWIGIPPIWSALAIGVFVITAPLVGAGWAFFLFLVANWVLAMLFLAGRMVFARMAYNFHQQKQFEHTRPRMATRVQDDEPLIIDLPVSQDARPMTRV